MKIFRGLQVPTTACLKKLLPCSEATLVYIEGIGIGIALCLSELSLTLFLWKSYATFAARPSTRIYAH